MFILSYLKAVKEKDPVLLVSRLFILICAGATYMAVNEPFLSSIHGGLIQVLVILLAVSVILSVVFNAAAWAAKLDWGWAQITEIILFLLCCLILIAGLVTHYFVASAIAAGLIFVELFVVLNEVYLYEKEKGGER